MREEIHSWLLIILHLQSVLMQTARNYCWWVMLSEWVREEKTLQHYCVTLGVCANKKFVCVWFLLPLSLVPLLLSISFPLRVFYVVRGELR